MVHTLSIFQHTRGPHAKKETSATHTPPTSLSFQFYTASSSLANSTRAFNNGISKEYEKIERCEQSNFSQTKAPSTKKKSVESFSCRLRRENWKTWQSPVILDLWLKKTRNKITRFSRFYKFKALSFQQPRSQALFPLPLFVVWEEDTGCGWSRDLLGQRKAV